jgi:uncharacterized protein YceH (UPF0502 family)
MTGTTMTDTISDESEPMLKPVEARVLGCLMEKQRTTPDQYPLTLNAVVTACNQKSARQPVMRLTPGEVGHTLGVLRDRGLVHASFAGRTERYDHKLIGTFMLDRQQAALLCALMLRGPQTPGELRTNTARLAKFDDLAALLESLEQLATHNPPLVRELPRQAGMREQRFGHLLCGEPALSVSTSSGHGARTTAVGADSPIEDELQARVARLEREVAELREALAGLRELVSGEGA